jgi:prepilin-type N-terminal cleavage/methylation domain-containing protein
MLESMMARSQRDPAAGPTPGFTVVELMVVVVVAAILLSLAVPSLREFMARQRVKAINAELVTDVQFARSESVARKLRVYITFRDDSAQLTCYTIQTGIGTAGGIPCDCRKPLGTACEDMPSVIELKTVQVPRSTTVTLQLADEQPDVIWFEEPRGEANPAVFQVTVASSISGKLRTLTNALGRPQVCSPDGSIGAVPVCQ